MFKFFRKFFKREKLESQTNLCKKITIIDIEKLKLTHKL